MALLPPPLPSVSRARLRGVSGLPCGSIQRCLVRCDSLSCINIMQQLEGHPAAARLLNGATIVVSRAIRGRCNAVHRDALQRSPLPLHFDQHAWHRWHCCPLFAAALLPAGVPLPAANCSRQELATYERLVACCGSVLSAAVVWARPALMNRQAHCRCCRCRWRRLRPTPGRRRQSGRQATAGQRTHQSFHGVMNTGWKGWCKENSTAGHTITTDFQARTWTMVSCCCCASVSPTAAGAGAAACELAAGCGVVAACCRAAAAGGCDSAATAPTGGTGGCTAALPGCTSGCWRSASVMCSIRKLVKVAHELAHLL